MKKPASGWSDLGHPVPGSEKDHPVPHSDFGHPVQAIFHLWLKGYRMMIEKLALDQSDHCFPGRFLGSCIATQNLVWAVALSSNHEIIDYGESSPTITANALLNFSEHLLHQCATPLCCIGLAI